MARYPLEALLSARRFREDAAAREAGRARAAAERARAAAEKADGESRRYREWRPAEEERLFERLRGKPAPLTSLDRHREDIEALRQRELALDEARRAAEKAAAEAEAAAERARQAQFAAVRDRRKIDEHRERWLRGEDRRLEAAEESALEDFPVRSGADGDDGARDWEGA